MSIVPLIRPGHGSRVRHDALSASTWLRARLSWGLDRDWAQADGSIGVVGDVFSLPAHARQPDADPSAASFAGARRADPPTVLLHNLARDVQTQTHAR